MRINGSVALQVYRSLLPAGRAEVEGAGPSIATEVSAPGGSRHLLALALPADPDCAH